MSSRIGSPLLPLLSRVEGAATAWTLLVASALAAAPLAGARLEARLVDQKGEPVEHGIVVAEPADGSAPPAATGTAIMDQIDEAFVPHVLAVPVGTEVTFPNKDDIRHHVYSFSDAKKFELPLYKGESAAPVLFDQPGEVVLGCNIHDHMRGYLLVVESPFYAQTDAEGRAEIEGLEAGTWEVRAWHPRQKKETAPESVEVAATGGVVELRVDLKPALRLRGTNARGRKY